MDHENGSTPAAAGKTGDPLDPRGLIAEAYEIPDIVAESCRSIFFDWALGRSEAEGAPESVQALHARYAAIAPDHPMTQVLAEGLQVRSDRPRKGRRAR